MMGHRFGRYESIRAIASGGMASVHLARSVGEGGFERLVAIKSMHPHIASDPDFRAMFLDEARLAARIRHPNVVGVLDVQKTGESLFLVMEYVDGPSLHQLRREFGKNSTTLPISITLRIFIDVLTGLHDAHELRDKDGQRLRRCTG
jgi:serine/threonine-protein kinase